MSPSSGGFGGPVSLKILNVYLFPNNLKQEHITGPLANLRWVLQNLAAPRDDLANIGTLFSTFHWFGGDHPPDTKTTLLLSIINLTTPPF